MGALDVDPREEKLPAWAREKLKEARRVAVIARREADEARLATNPDDTDVIIGRWNAIPIGLPPGERVRFIVGPNRSHDWIEVHTDGDRIEVTGDRALNVHPRVSNVVRICLNER